MFVRAGGWKLEPKAKVSLAASLFAKRDFDRRRAPDCAAGSCAHSSRASRDATDLLLSTTDDHRHPRSAAMVPGIFATYPGAIVRISARSRIFELSCRHSRGRSRTPKLVRTGDCASYIERKHSQDTLAAYQISRKTRVAQLFAVSNVGPGAKASQAQAAEQIDRMKKKALAPGRARKNDQVPFRTVRSGCADHA